MSVFEAVIGWLAPPTCISCGKEGSSICRKCAAGRITPFGERCWRCNRLSTGSITCHSCRHTGSPGRVWIATNYDGVARTVLSSFKFEHQRAAALPIAEMMADTLLTSDSGALKNNDYLVVPVTTATARVRERGFDHTGLLAENVAFTLRLNNSNALRRLGQARQLGSKREDRLVQLNGSFAVRNPLKVRGRNILLVDDVVTTGGTMIAAAKALRAAGAKSVDAIIFAKKL